jgi:hypothetical protein
VLPAFDSLFVDSLSDLIAESEVILVGKKITEVSESLSRLDEAQIVIDLIGWEELNNIPCQLIKLTT